MFYSCKVVPQEIQVKMINLQIKMAVKVTKKVKYATALYHKIDATGSRLTIVSRKAKKNQRPLSELFTRNTAANVLAKPP